VLCLCIYLEVLVTYLKSRCRENAENSPLLRLPPELRIRIFEYVLGGHTIHVEQFSQTAAAALRKYDVRVGLGLYNGLCQSTESEEEAYKRFQDLSQDSSKVHTPFFVPKNGQDLGRNYYVEPWSTRHSECGREPNPRRVRIELESWLQRPRFSSAALRTCRQIYAETRSMPYALNTFCFRDAGSFQAFALSLRPGQTRAIQHLNLLVGVGTAPFSNARARSWVHALRLHSIVRWLGSLKSLELSVEAYINTADPHIPRKPKFEQFYEILQSPDGTPTSWMAQLSSLCRSKNCVVKVVVADDPSSAWGAEGKALYCRDYRFNDSEWCFRRAIGCLTIAEKKEFATKIEDLLRVDEDRWRLLLGDTSSGKQHPDSD